MLGRGRGILSSRQQQPETRPERQPETRPERQPETRPGIQPETHPGRQPERRPERQPETRPGRQPETRPGRQPETRPGRQPETRPERQPETRPGRQPETRPGRPDGAGDRTLTVNVQRDVRQVHFGDEPSLGPNVKGGSSEFPANWNPMKDDFENPEFNSYNRGPGRDLPKDLHSTRRNTPPNKRSHISLYIANIPREVQTTGLEELFGRYGDVLNPRVIIRPGDLTGIGFVSYRTVREAQNALELNGFEVQGHFLRVKFARTEEENQEIKRRKMEEERLVSGMPPPGTRSDWNENWNQGRSPRRSMSPHHSMSPRRSMSKDRIFGDGTLSDNRCTFCGIEGAHKKCSACKTPYCSTDCQRGDWEKGHFAKCKSMKKDDSNKLQSGCDTHTSAPEDYEPDTAHISSPAVQQNNAPNVMLDDLSQSGWGKHTSPPKELRPFEDYEPDTAQISSPAHAVQQNNAPNVMLDDLPQSGWGKHTSPPKELPPSEDSEPDTAQIPSPAHAVQQNNAPNVLLNDLLRDKVEEQAEEIEALKITVQKQKETLEAHESTIEAHERTIEAHERTIEAHERTIEEQKLNAEELSMALTVLEPYKEKYYDELCKNASK